MVHEHQPFRRARLTLTFSYLAILSVILFVFSTSLFVIQSRDVISIVVKREYGTNIPQTLSSDERQDIKYQASLLRFRLIRNLLFIDLLIVFFGGSISYVLAGKTLEPINEAINQQKAFTQDASHELRTPITAIISASEIALRVKNQSASDYKQTLTQIHGESRRLSRIVEELLLLSRADAGTIQFAEKPIELSQLVADTMMQLAPLAKKKHLQVEQILGKQVTITGDPDKLQQLIIILVDNAIKYTPEKGRITINTQNNPKPTLSVTDNGIGMSHTDKEHIFERFYQADKARAKGGSGLGLSIAKWIAEMHQATITVSSQKGSGSTFVVIFPPTDS